METPKVVTIRVQLLKTIFRTFGNGKLGALIHFRGCTDFDIALLNRNAIGAVLVDSITEISKHGLYSLSEFEILFNTETGNISFEKQLSRSSPTPAPRNCPSCGGNLRSHATRELWCDNKLCPAHSLSCVRRLAHDHLPMHHAAQLDEFLLEYQVQGENYSINNLFEFKNAFLDSNNFNKRNTLRVEQWQQKFGKGKGRVFWEIEHVYQEVLSRPSIDTKEFWTTCSFPFEGDQFLNQIPHDFAIDGQWLNPQHFVDGSTEMKWRFKLLSAHSRKLLTDNLTFIRLLLDVYNHPLHKKEKTIWT